MGEKKSSVPLQQFSTKTTCVLQYHMCSTVTVMGWRLVVGGGWWRLVVGGGWRLIVGGGWWLGVGGGLQLAAVVRWCLAAVGGG